MSHSSPDVKELIELGESIVQRARSAGADVAEASVQSGSHLSVKSRLKEPELVEEAGSRALGLRVMLGQRVAATYTSDLSDAGQQLLIEDALELAKLSEPDEFAGPPEASLLSKPSDWVDLDTFDDSVSGISADEALERALVGERAAFDLDPRITNSEGASFSRARGVSALVTSGGFAGGDVGTYASVVVTPVADDEDGKKRRGYHWSAARHYSALESSADVGTIAADLDDGSTTFVGVTGHDFAVLQQLSQHLVGQRVGALAHPPRMANGRTQLGAVFFGDEQLVTLDHQCETRALVGGVQHSGVDLDYATIEAFEDPARHSRRMADGNASRTHYRKGLRDDIAFGQFTAPDGAAIPERAVRRVHRRVVERDNRIERADERRVG